MVIDGHCNFCGENHFGCRFQPERLGGLGVRGEVRISFGCFLHADYFTFHNQSSIQPCKICEFEIGQNYPFTSLMNEH